MDTIIHQISDNENDINDIEALKKAGEIIREGGLVAFPTETVYGLGADALNPEASKKIYAAKGRPSDNPLIVHIAKPEDLEQVAKNISNKARMLASKFWPGPLTMIFEKADCVPKETTGGLDTVAVRLPLDRIARDFIEASNRYIAAPSANISGRPSPTAMEYVVEDMNGRIDMIIGGGDSVIGLESTIIDMTVDTPMILRPGYITKEMIEECIGETAVDQTILSSESGIAPKAPGMKYRHYAPKAELIIVEGDSQKVVDYINKQIEENKALGRSVGIICTDETKQCFEADSIKSVGKRQSSEDIARNLFRVLREFDNEKIDIIYSESFSKEGVGMAIMNRLRKAAGQTIIELK